jgi:hypothetical protein
MIPVRNRTRRVHKKGREKKYEIKPAPTTVRRTSLRAKPNKRAAWIPSPGFPSKLLMEGSIDVFDEFITVFI